MSLYIEGYWEYAPGCPANFDFVSKSDDPKEAVEQVLAQYPDAVIVGMARLLDEKP